MWYIVYVSPLATVCQQGLCRGVVQLLYNMYWCMHSIGRYTMCSCRHIDIVCVRLTNIKLGFRHDQHMTGLLPVRARIAVAIQRIVDTVNNESWCMYIVHVQCRAGLHCTMHMHRIRSMDTTYAHASRVIVETQIGIQRTQWHISPSVSLWILLSAADGQGAS